MTQLPNYERLCAGANANGAQVTMAASLSAGLIILTGLFIGTLF